MRIFVTGGTGFIGGHFINRAFASGHQVVALRRDGASPRITLSAEPDWIDGDLDGNYPSVFKGVNAFVHLASHTTNPPYAPLQECLYWNVYAATCLAMQAADQGVSRFVIAGSCFEYGRTADELRALSVDSPLKPFSTYPISKAAASLAFEGFCRDRWVSLTLCRIFQAYGEGEHETRFWPSLRRAALSGENFPMSSGSQIREFVSAAEVARALMLCVESPPPLGDPRKCHIVGTNPQSLLAFAKDWWIKFGAKGQLLPGALPPRTGEMMRIVSIRDDWSVISPVDLP